MLDEPTNHLDMHSCDLLIEALNKYAGSIILVSHDRYFISKTANKIWEIVDHEVKEFKGGYEEWVAWKERMSAKKTDDSKQVNDDASKNRDKKQEARDKNPEVKNKVQESTIIAKATNNNQQSINKDQQLTNNLSQDRDAKKELQRLQRKFQQLEEQVNKANQKKAEIEKSLSDPDIYANPQNFAATEKSYKEITIDLQKLNAEYESLFEKIVALES
jgi:ATP-binding cassette subfamily F protein 3